MCSLFLASLRKVFQWDYFFNFSTFNRNIQIIHNIQILRYTNSKLNLYVKFNNNYKSIFLAVNNELATGWEKFQLEQIKAGVNVSP